MTESREVIWMAPEQGRKEAFSPVYAQEGCFTAHKEHLLLSPLIPTSVQFQMKAIKSRCCNPCENSGRQWNLEKLSKSHNYDEWCIWDRNVLACWWQSSLNPWEPPKTEIMCCTFESRAPLPLLTFSNPPTPGLQWVRLEAPRRCLSQDDSLHPLSECCLHVSIPDPYTGVSSK